MIVQHISAAKSKDLNMTFAKDIQETTTFSNFFERPSCVAFFNVATPACNVPHQRDIGGKQLDNLCVKTVTVVVDAVRKAGGCVLSIEGATNCLAKLLSNVIVHSLGPLFFDYLRSDMKLETFENVVIKVMDVLTRLEKETSIPNTMFTFVSSSCNGMREVRFKMLEQGLVLWESGCSTHCMHNL